MYKESIEKNAADYNLDPALVASIIRNESSFRAQVESATGARGLMQLMPDTATWISSKMGISDYSFDSMFDPETNIQFGCWYLNYLSTLFDGDTVCIVSAYHIGQGQVSTWLNDSSISEDGKV